jgi:WD40 repeat protein
MASDTAAKAFSPDSKLLACKGRSGMQLRDVATGQVVRALVGPPVAAAAFSPDGKTLAGGGYQQVVFWDVQTGALRRTDAK